jgi:hypothetical protein
MANWDAITVKAAVTRIRDESLVLPVIQRRLIWDEDKMELLFDTLLRSNSFGGIMSIEEEKDAQPIFAFREFTVDGTPVKSKPIPSLTKSHNLVIDGQQRLQTFYIGLWGSYAGKQLYFDLYSDYEENDFNFRFAADPASLPSKDEEKSNIKDCFWYLTKRLFTRFDLTNDEDQVSEEIVREQGITDPEMVKYIQKNVRLFYKNVFNQPHVGIARVTINKSEEITKSRQKIVELFRRLNDGGTKLSAFDLAASIMKGFDWKMEAFLDEMLIKNRNLGLTQDNLLKLIFLLRDNSAKEMMDIDQVDAAFAVENKERIDQALSACIQFLRLSNLLNYYSEARPSFIPIFFIVYHLFYSGVPTPQLQHYFDKYETSNSDYPLIFKWVMFSLLNGVFRSRGAGWIPYKTGIRKILSVMRRNRGQSFPFQELTRMYEAHPLTFTDQVTENSLNTFDRAILFLVLYKLPQGVREQDVDHIQPVSLLRQNPDYDKMINVVENYQLLDVGTNRGVKSAKPLNEWILKDVQNREVYLEKHFIPREQELWRIERYTDFITARRTILIRELKARLYIQEA